MSDFHTSHRIIPADEINYTAEAGLVQERAARGEPSVIRLGPIVLFSTANVGARNRRRKTCSTTCSRAEWNAGSHVVHPTC